MNERSVLMVNSGEVGWAAVRAALQERDDVSIVGEAQTYDSALFYANTHQIDLLLVSDRLAEASSHATLAELRATSCDTSLMGLFVNGLGSDELERFGELELAACCRWDELRTTEAIDAALAAILTGDLLVGTPEVARDYFQITHGTTQGDHDAGQLSELDRQILAALAQGFTAEEIARSVSRARDTIYNRLYELRGRLGTRTNPPPCTHGDSTPSHRSGRHRRPDLTLTGRLEGREKLPERIGKLLHRQDCNIPLF